MSGIAKLRWLGLLWTGLIGVTLAAIEPAIRTYSILFGVFILLAGWWVLRGVIKPVGEADASARGQVTGFDGVGFTDQTGAAITQCSN